MARYFLIAVIVFFLYWGIKGVLRRFLAPPRQRVRRKVPGSHAGETVPERRRRNAPIDYSKVKDANYRDLD